MSAMFCAGGPRRRTSFLNAVVSRVQCEVVIALMGPGETREEVSDKHGGHRCEPYGFDPSGCACADVSPQILPVPPLTPSVTAVLHVGFHRVTPAPSRVTRNADLE